MPTNRFAKYATIALLSCSTAPLAATAAPAMPDAGPPTPAARSQAAALAVLRTGLDAKDERCSFSPVDGRQIRIARAVPIHPDGCAAVGRDDAKASLDIGLARPRIGER